MFVCRGFAGVSASLCSGLGCGHGVAFKRGLPCVLLDWLCRVSLVQIFLVICGCPQCQGISAASDPCGSKVNTCCSNCAGTPRMAPPGSALAELQPVRRHAPLALRPKMKPHETHCGRSGLQVGKRQSKHFTTKPLQGETCLLSLPHARIFNNKPNAANVALY